MPTKTVALRLDVAMWRKVKAAAALAGKSLTEVVTEALTQWLKGGAK